MKCMCARKFEKLKERKANLLARVLTDVKRSQKTAGHLNVVEELISVGWGLRYEKQSSDRESMKPQLTGGKLSKPQKIHEN